MNEAVAAVGCERKTGFVYILAEGEMIINASPKDVWPCALDYASWQDFTTLRHVSGEPGEEGEVVAMEKEAGGHVFKLYNARTIKLEPGRRVIWKTYRDEQEGGDQATDGLSFGIVEFQVHEAQGSTRFNWKCLYEYVVPYMNEDELSAFRNQQNVVIDNALAELFPRLKNLVECPKVTS